MTQKQEFIDFINQLSNLDVENTPKYKTIKELYWKLIDVGFNLEEASKIVGMIEIEVSQKFVDDPELFATCAVFARTIRNLYESFYKIDPRIFWISLEYSEQSKLKLMYNITSLHYFIDKNFYSKYIYLYVFSRKTIHWNKT